MDPEQSSSYICDDEKSNVGEKIDGPFEKIRSLSYIVTQQKHYLDNPLVIQKEIKILDAIGDMQDILSSMYALSATPTPFNYVNVARTILIAWLGFIPFFELPDIGYRIVLIPIIFFVTFGTMGLDAVGSEITDPFGDDPNDLEIEALRDAEIAHISRLLSESKSYYYEIEHDEFVPSKRRCSHERSNDNDIDGNFIIPPDNSPKIYDTKKSEQIMKCHKFAQKLISRGKCDGALALLVKALSFAVEPQDIATCVSKIAQCYERQGRYNEALQFYQREQDVYNGFLSKLSKSSNCAEQKHLFDRKKVQVSLKIGHILFECEQYAKALVVYEQVLASLGAQNHQRKQGTNYQTDTTSFEECDDRIRVRVGMLYFHAMNHERALDCFWDVMQQLQKNDLRPSARATTSHKSNQTPYRLSLQSYQTKSDLLTANILFCMGMVHHEKREMKWAITRFCEAVTILRRQLMEMDESSPTINGKSNGQDQHNEYIDEFADMLGWALARLSLAYTDANMVGECSDTLGALQRFASNLHSNTDKQQSVGTSRNELNNNNTRHDCTDDDSSTAMVSIGNTCTNTNSQSNHTQSQSQLLPDSSTLAGSSGSMTPTSKENNVEKAKPTIWDDTKLILKRFRETTSEDGNSTSTNGSERSHFFGTANMSDVFIVG